MSKMQENNSCFWLPMIFCPKNQKQQQKHMTIKIHRKLNIFLSPQISQLYSLLPKNHPSTHSSKYKKHKLRFLGIRFVLLPNFILLFCICSLDSLLTHDGSRRRRNPFSSSYPHPARVTKSHAIAVEPKAWCHRTHFVTLQFTKKQNFLRLIRSSLLYFNEKQKTLCSCSAETESTWTTNRFFNEQSNFTSSEYLGGLYYAQAQRNRRKKD